MRELKSQNGKIQTSNNKILQSNKYAVYAANHLSERLKFFSSSPVNLLNSIAMSSARC